MTTNTDQPPAAVAARSEAIHDEAMAHLDTAIVWKRIIKADCAHAVDCREAHLGLQQNLKPKPPPCLRRTTLTSRHGRFSTEARRPLPRTSATSRRRSGLYRRRGRGTYRRG